MGVGKFVCHRLERKHHHCHCHYRSAQWLAEFCFFCHNYSALKFYYRKDTIFFTGSITKTEKTESILSNSVRHVRKMALYPLYILYQFSPFASIAV